MRNVIFLCTFILASISLSAQNYWQPNGTSIYYNNGNVGIGTTSPRAKLETIGSGKFSASPTGSCFYIETSGLSTSNDYSNVRLVASSALGKGYLQSRLDNYGGSFTWVRGSATGDVPLMTIDATNVKVGIGTTAPTAKLDLGELKIETLAGFPAEGSVTDNWGSYIVGNINGGQKL